MNYIIALLAIMAIATCLVTFPIPTIVAIAVATIWWVVKGSKGNVR